MSRFQQPPCEDENCEGPHILCVNTHLMKDEVLELHGRNGLELSFPLKYLVDMARFAISKGFQIDDCVRH